MARALNFIPLCIALVALVAACGDDSRPPTGGVCTPACATGLSCCGGGCVSTTTSPENCGGCGITCAGGQSCSGGVCSGGPTMDGSVVGTDSSVPSMCTPACSADERCCGSSCFDRAAPAGQLDARSHESFANCNGCGLGCDMNRASRCGSMAGGGAAQCLCGNTAQCPTGQACVNQGGSFLCADLRFDPMNCGAIGNACGEGESCSNGMCGCGSTGMGCGEGQACCGGSCISTASDPMNCGGCGTVCGPNAPNCNAGSCGCGTGGACTAPGVGSIGQSCCDGTCVANSDTNCGCGEVCEGGDTCQAGMSFLDMGMTMGVPDVCCGGPEVLLLGCGGFMFPGLP